MARLVNGTNVLSGLVEVYINGSWGTVCGEEWDIANAMVVCGQLDYGKALEASAQPPTGNSEMVLDAVSCTGKEDNLMDCPRNPSVPDCDSANKIAAVVCSAPSKLQFNDNLCIYMVFLHRLVSPGLNKSYYYPWIEHFYVPYILLGSISTLGSTELCASISPHRNLINYSNHLCPARFPFIFLGGETQLGVK